MCLSVRTMPFTEHYRRYYFRDIQAIVLTESGSPVAYYLYASAAFLLLMFLLLGYSWHPVWATLCGITGAILLTLRIARSELRLLSSNRHGCGAAAFFGQNTRGPENAGHSEACHRSSPGATVDMTPAFEQRCLHHLSREAAVPLSGVPELLLPRVRDRA